MFRPQSWLVLVCGLALASCTTPKQQSGGGRLSLPRPPGHDRSGRGGAPAPGAVPVGTNTPPGEKTVGGRSATPPPPVSGQATATKITTNSVTTTLTNTATNVVTGIKGQQPAVRDQPSEAVESGPGMRSGQGSPAGDQRLASTNPPPAGAPELIGAAQPEQRTPSAAGNRSAASRAADTPFGEGRERATQRGVAPNPCAIASGAAARTDRAPALALDGLLAAPAVCRTAEIKTAIAPPLPGNPPVEHPHPPGSPHLPATEPDILNDKPVPPGLHVWHGLGDRRLDPDQQAQGPEFSVPASIRRDPAGLQAAALRFDVAGATNTHDRAPPPRALRLDSLFDQDAAAANWREQQLARQTAQQQARDEERRKLQRFLYELLFPPKSGRGD
ncbi:MAG: hypothetical protein NTV49_03365 [Kiritimatiellaeota bacterium]|nr:hypothetical protein [Kiritimatiellota bacterium]